MVGKKRQREEGKVNKIARGEEIRRIESVEMSESEKGVEEDKQL